MHWTTHVITGGALGYLIDRPVPAALAGLSSHLVTDVLPHYDPKSEVGYVSDGLLGIATLLLIARSRRVRDIDTRRAALWGAIGAALPDVELLRNLVEDVGNEQYVFPAHDGTLPHLQTDPVISTIFQAALTSILLALAWQKLRLERLRQG